MNFIEKELSDRIKEWYYELQQNARDNNSEYIIIDGTNINDLLYSLGLKEGEWVDSFRLNVIGCLHDILVLIRFSNVEAVDLLYMIDEQIMKLSKKYEKEIGKLAPERREGEAE